MFSLVFSKFLAMRDITLYNVPMYMYYEMKIAGGAGWSFGGDASRSVPRQIGDCPRGWPY